MNWSRSAVIHAVAIALVTVSTAVAHAEVVVLQSNAPGLKTGAVLKDSDTIDVPAGKSVILVLPSGSTKTITGPLKESVSSLAQGQSRNAALLDAVKKYVSTGGGTAGKVGAMRSAAPIMAERTKKSFSWTEIPVTADGDYCVSRTSGIRIVRTSSRQPLDLTIVDMQESKRVKVVFEAGAQTAAWPEGVPLQVGKYAFVVKGQPLNQFRLRVIDPVPSKEETLRVLFTQRCESQVQSYLQVLASGN